MFKVVVTVIALSSLSSVVVDGIPRRYCYVPEPDHYIYKCVGYGEMPEQVPRDATTLNMSGSHVQSINGKALVKAGATAVKNLYFQGNDIRALHRGDTCGLDNMRVLDLSANKLETIDEDALECNPNLKRLDLSNNPLLKLTSLSSSSLTDLYLDNSGISLLDVNLLQGLPNLQNLYLRNYRGLSCAEVQEEMTRRGYGKVEFICTELSSTPTTEDQGSTMHSTSNTATQLTTKLAPPAQDNASITENVSQAPSSDRREKSINSGRSQWLNDYTVVLIGSVTFAVLLGIIIGYYILRRMRKTVDKDECVSGRYERVGN